MYKILNFYAVTHPQKWSLVFTAIAINRPLIIDIHALYKSTFNATIITIRDNNNAAHLQSEMP